MEEIWKDILGHEDSYQISNLGHVRSKDRVIFDKIGRTRHLKGKLLAPKSNVRTKYCFVNLNGHDYYVHRLVARAFVPNPNNYPEINHKDENRQNNEADNLEWCTRKYNHDYGNRTEREAQTKSKKVIQLNKKGEVIAVFSNAIEANKVTGVNRRQIQMVAAHYRYVDKHGQLIRYLTAGGFKWEYAKEGLDGKYKEEKQS